MRIHLGDEPGPQSNSLRDALYLLDYLEERKKKDEEDKKKKDDPKKKSPSAGGSDIIGNAILLTLIQIVAVPCTIYAWGWAMQSVVESLKLISK